MRTDESPAFGREDLIILGCWISSRDKNDDRAQHFQRGQRTRSSLPYGIHFTHGFETGLQVHQAQ